MRKLLCASTCVFVFASAAAAGAGKITPIRLGAHGELGIFPPLQSVATLRDGRFATLWSVDSFNGKGFLQYIAQNGVLAFPAPGILVATTVSRSRDYEAPGFGCFDGTTLRIVWEHYALGKSPSEIHFTALDAAGNRLIRRAGVPLTDAMELTGLHGFACNPDTGVSFLIWDVAADSDILGLLYNPTVR